MKTYSNYLELKTMKKTFLNCSREHKTFPKHLMIVGFCEFCIAVGSALCIMRGNKYQSS